MFVVQKPKGYALEEPLLPSPLEAHNFDRRPLTITEGHSVDHRYFISFCNIGEVEQDRAFRCCLSMKEL